MRLEERAADVLVERVGEPVGERLVRRVGMSSDFSESSIDLM